LFFFCVKRRRTFVFSLFEGGDHFFIVLRFFPRGASVFDKEIALSPLISVSFPFLRDWTKTPATSPLPGDLGEEEPLATDTTGFLFPLFLPGGEFIVFYVLRASSPPPSCDGKWSTLPLSPPARSGRVSQVSPSST